MIHDGYITWRYWLRRVRQVECDLSNRPESVTSSQPGRNKSGEAIDSQALHPLPCRIVIKTRGLQWFIYSRSPAYDAILKSMAADQTNHEAAPEVRPTQTNETVPKTEIRAIPSFLSVDQASSSMASKAADVFDNLEDKDDADSVLSPLSNQSSTRLESENTTIVPSILRVLPIRIDCNKGAIVMGNRNTQSILTAKFDGATGHVDARDSRSIDKYKQLIDFEFTHPVIQLKTNREYKESQIVEGGRYKSEDGQSTASRGNRFIRFRFGFEEKFFSAWRSFRVRFPNFRGSEHSLAQDRSKTAAVYHHSGNDATIPGQSRWLGLTRYLDDDDELIEQERWKAIEYGQYPTIVDSPKIAMCFYWDVPGLVPISYAGSVRPFELKTDDINGDLPPDWGVHLRIFGGNIRYGPWADRQRLGLQAVFFPSLHKDATPADRLEPGSARLSTVFKLVLEVEEQTILGIATREESKDWRWKGRETRRTGTDLKQSVKKGRNKKKEETDDSTPDIRPFGWLDIKIFANSTISFTMDLVAKSHGFGTQVYLDLHGSEISTSVNHGLLWRSKSQKLSCKLSYPLKWNASHLCHIDLHSDGPELFILRDHIFLLTDVVSDWASGPPGEFYTFVPYHYVINLHFNDCNIYVNANDSNIINNPSDIDDNTFLTFWGKDLTACINIPLESFRPTRTRIEFDVEAHDGGMQLRAPPWNTYHTFLDNSNVANLRDLRINGSYEYFGSTLPGLTDTMVLNIHGMTLKIHLYGFLIRYLMKIKDNYFGEDLHFRTVEEYQKQMSRQEKSDGEITVADHHARLSNDLDVILGVTAEKLCVILPSHVYSATENVTMEMSSIGLDLRFTNYYMDFAITFSPISISLIGPAKDLGVAAEPHSGTHVFIDGLQIFGHRLFGLPPTEPTYVCNWDFDVGAVTGEICVELVSSLILALRCFTFVFEDAENALPCSHLQVIHDVTFLRVRVQPVQIWVRLEQAAFLISLTEVKLKYNDLAGQLFSEKLHVKIPNATLAVVDIGGTSVDQTSLHSSVLPAAYLETKVDVRMVKHKLHFIENRRLQQSHISQQDSRTHRIPWLVREPEHVAVLGSTIHRSKINPPAMPFPLMPEPVLEGSDPVTHNSSSSSDSFNTITSKKTPTRKRSFLARTSLRQSRSKQFLSRKASTSQFSENGANSKPPAIGRESDSYVIYSRQPPTLYDQGRTQQKSARLDFAFSSPYKRPHFPLSNTSLDLNAIPVQPGYVSSKIIDNAINLVEPYELQHPDEETEQTSFVLDFTQGIRAFCMPVALLRMNDLMAKLQMENPVSLIDKLQIESMTEVLKSIQVCEDHKKIVDIRVAIPNLEAQLMNTPGHGQSMVSQRHQYQLSLKKLIITTRSLENSLNDEHIAIHESSVNLILGQMSFSALGFYETFKEQDIIRVSIYNIVFWMYTGSNPVIDVKFSDLDIVNSSREVSILVSLVQQTFTLSHDIMQVLSSVKDEETPRLRLLVLLLTENGDKNPKDPPFLTKASYVLRGATSHPRTVDSWKMISRLRYIQKSIPDLLQEQILAHTTQERLTYPENAGERVITSFDRWRAWDMVHVRQSHLMQKVYGPLINPSEERIGRNFPLKASIHAWNVRCLIEPGPNQSELVLDNLIAQVAMNQPPTNRLHPGKPSEEQSSLVQVCWTKIRVDLNWDLRHYIEKIYELSQKLRRDLPSGQDGLSTAKASAQTHHLQLMISSETNILSLKSSNLTIFSIGTGFRASIILDPSPNSAASSINAIITLKALTSELQSNSRLVAHLKLWRPTLSGFTQKHYPEIKMDGIWRLAGSCDELSIEVLEEPLELLKILAAILRDEGTHIGALVRRLQQTSETNQLSIAVPNQGENLRVYLLLSLDSYTFRISILPSLTYSISGKLAQSSVQPAGQNSSQILVNFDLGEHSHIFTIRERDRFDTISALGIPPLNGRFGVALSSDQSSIDLHLLVEKALLEASTVQALLVILSHTEIISLSKHVAQELTTIKRLWEQKIFSAKPTSKRVSTSILYNTQISLVGLIIHADAPRSISIAGPARLQLHSGCILLKATNRGSELGQAMKYPELELSLKKIEIDLSKYDRSELHSSGDVCLGVVLQIASKYNDENELVRAYTVCIHRPVVNLYSETASMIIDIVGHLQDTLKKIDLSREVRSLRRLTQTRRRSERVASNSILVDEHNQDHTTTALLFNAMYSLEVINVCVTWKIGASAPPSPGREAEDLILSFTKIDLATKRDNAARLLIEDFQIQMAPALRATTSRSLNSALLPEVVFNVAYLSTATERRLAFQAAGKSLDLRLTSQFILPANDLRRSVAIAIDDVRKSTASWNAARTQSNSHGTKLLGEKRLASLLIDADFAGAVVHVQGRSVLDPQSLALNVLRGKRSPQHGRYGQFTQENESSSTTLRAPGIALKVEYTDAGNDEPSLNAEIKVDASSNVLYPAIVPLIMEMSSSVKDIVAESESTNHPLTPKLATPKFLGDERPGTADPSTIFNHCKLNLGLRVRRQEFGLSCQPIARVAATARFETIYVTLNTVQSPDKDQFFTLSATFDHLQASVQHVYSRESTGSFVVDSIVLSLMNSKHVSTMNGLSAILKISPMKAQINTKQLHDFLLFREIWVPPDLRQPSPGPGSTLSSEPQAYIVQRYQQVAAASAFPWNATVSVAELDVQIDLGQSLGKSTLVISDFWVSTKKSSDWEQNLCLGFEKVGINSVGRMSGYVEFRNFGVRTSIRWPAMEQTHSQAPLVQASLGFDHLRVKAAFDFEAFLIADITTFDFLMYNVRDSQQTYGDRLVGVVDGEKVQIFCTATSASQGLALYQTIERLIQDRQMAYEASLRDIEKLLRRKSSINPYVLRAAAKKQEGEGEVGEKTAKAPLQLQTNVVVTLKTINIGAFPSTFFDNQIFKLEALGASARFAVILDQGRLHSSLGMTLGQLRVAVSGLTRTRVPKTLGEVSLDEVVAGATGSQGGTILKVPKVVASMQTWQDPESTHIDYIFHSSFQGKVDVGWNYSRIGFLRGMWNTHTRTLAHRLGKPLPPSALQITGGLQPEEGDGRDKPAEGGEQQAKITAVVNVPQSKFQYTALQPAVIETPQLRDMGEATPPLEWIGLHRERLPNLTHQIVIVSLLEVAKEVEDAYHRILGSS